jgi:DNA-binding LacI/PurR family transcriptional regulator
MSGKGSVLVIGIEPTLIDFSSPEYAPFHMDAAKVMAGLKASEESLSRLGYDVQFCLTDFGATAEATLREQLEKKRFDCIVIGAGVRAVAGNLLLFEKLINVVHACAPQAKLCFNTNPMDTAEAVQRWI